MHIKLCRGVGCWTAVNHFHTVCGETKRFQNEKVRANILEAG